MAKSKPTSPAAAATAAPASPLKGAPVFAAEIEAAKSKESPEPPATATGTTAPEPARRRDTEDERASQLGLPRTPVTAITSNQRRTSTGIAARFFAASIVIMLAAFGTFAAMLFSFYQTNIVPALARSQSSARQPHELEAPAHGPGQSADLAAAQTALQKANESILRLQREYDALAAKQQATESSFSKMVEQMKKALDEQSKEGKATPSTSSLSAALSVASVVPIASPVSEELRILKERNRLTFYADQAIATGSSEAMDNLWLSLDDPELTKLRDGAMAEIIRVQNYYSQLSRLPPDFRLPVQTLFKDPGIRSEADLQPDQVIRLLLDQKQPMEIRARAAYVLGGHPNDPKIASALFQAMTTDPSLDVMKEVQRTLSLDHGMIIPPLNARAAKVWRKEKQDAK